MKHYGTSQQGVTLIELLITMVVLMLILGGIYGMLNSANKMYMTTRALSESQQTVRVVMNYLVFRLREMDGGGSTGSLGRDPRYCTDCHISNLDKNENVDDPYLPCALDVLIPRRNLYLLNLTTLPLPTLAGVPAEYQHLNGHNAINFWADLLPQQGVSDTFVNKSADINATWDLVYDKNENGRYDARNSDREMLFFDYNDNGRYDYYGERWSFRLMTATGVRFFNVVETLAFGPYTSANRSIYNTYMGDADNTVYQDIPVAYGVTGLGITTLPIYPDQAAMLTALGGVAELQSKARDSCGNPTDSSKNMRSGGCHGTAGTPPTCLDSSGNFDFASFIQVHPWWNIKGFTVEIAATDLSELKYIKTKQLVIPRNLEVNQR